MHRLISFAFLAVLAIWSVYAQDQILMPGGHWDLLGEGYQLTADSAVDKAGNVYFTDARRNRILKIDPDGNISTWKEGSNGAHGVALGPDGRLYAGQHDRKRIVAFSSDGTESVIAEGVGPHHLTVTSRNHIYFNEPPAHKVWLVDAAGLQRVVHDGINWPHAVRVSPDESFLVVNDPPTRWVWSFRIQADGSLIDGRRFYRLETRGEKSETDAGGMAFDSDGFLYVATDIGVQVCDQRGRVIAVIDVLGEGAANVFFGGRGLEWLYVTDGNKIWRRPAKRQGAPLTIQPRQPW